MHIAMITAGGAGMFCGSCMHDNTWARAMRDSGHEVTLIPTYTPVRLDEDDLSEQRVFLGGLNVYLDHRVPLWNRLPRWTTRWLDHPAVIRFATRFAVSNDARALGELTLDMLAGESGSQHREIQELVQFLADELRPDVIIFSNALLVGVLRRLKEQFDGPVFCALQGDDIFLDGLPPRHRGQVLERLHERAMEFDGFVVHSRFYRDQMADLVGLPVERFHQIPLGVSVDDADPQPRPAGEQEFRIGYFARVCPEKGVHRMLEAFRVVHRRHPHTRLLVGGYLGARDRTWFERLQAGFRDLGPAVEYIGSPPDHASKVRFLNSLHALSVPTVYREPKGIPVLEALACGVPVVQPEHGAFPEMLAATGGGLLCVPDNPESLAAGLCRLVEDPELRMRLAREGAAGVRRAFSPEVMAAATAAFIEPFLHNRKFRSSGVVNPR